MKFQANRLLCYDDESILEEIHRVYKEHFQNKKMGIREFNKFSRVKGVTVIKRFGSWAIALEKAGIHYEKCSISKSDIIESIKLVLKKNDDKFITFREYQELGGKYSLKTIKLRFDNAGWREILEKHFSVVKIHKIIKMKKSTPAISEEELMIELDRVWNSIGRRPTYLEFRELSEYGTKRYEKRYGTWGNAIEHYCMIRGIIDSASNGAHTTKKLLISELQEIVKDNCLEILNQGDYKKYGGKYSIQTFYNHFGSWKNAKEAAGLKIGNSLPSQEEFFNELQRIWELFGRQPKFSEMKKLGKYSAKSYIGKFSSWTSAIYMFIEDRESEETRNVEIEDRVTISNSEKDILPDKKENDEFHMRTPRFPSSRLRFSVLKRDNFTCKMCGASPQRNKDVILHIDHIIPYSKGGETVLQNLQTLCSRCNIGKGDLM